MMQIIPKWKVSVYFKDLDPFVFWVHDQSVSNVLRTVAGMQFSEDGCMRPASITVAAVDV